MFGTRIRSVYGQQNQWSRVGLNHDRVFPGPSRGSVRERKSRATTICMLQAAHYWAAQSESWFEVEGGCFIFPASILIYGVVRGFKCGEYRISGAVLVMRARGT